MTTEELKVIVSAETSKFDSAMKGVSKQMSGLKSAVGTVVKTGAAVTGAVAGAGAAVFGFADKVSKTGDTIEKQSQKMGVSAEQYQVLAHAAEHSGFSVGVFQKAQAKLLKDDPSANIMDTVNSLMAIENPAERSAKAIELFGAKTAQEMAPLLNNSQSLDDYRESLEQMGGLMSDEMVENSAAFQDALTDVKTAMSGLGVVLATNVMPVVTDVMNGIVAFTKSAEFDTIKDKVQNFGNAVATYVVPAILDFFNAGKDLVSGVLDKLSPAIDKAADAFKSFIDKGGIEKITNTLKTLSPVIAAVVAGFIAFKTYLLISSAISAVSAALAVLQGTEISLAAVQAALNAVMAANPIMLIVIAVAALVAGIITLWNTNEGFRNAVISAWEALKNAFSTAVTSIQGWLAALSQKVSAIKASIVSTFNNMKARIQVIFTAIKAVVGSVVQALVTNVQTRFNAMKTIVKGIMGVFKGIVTGDFRAVVSSIRGIMSGVVSLITSPFKTAWSVVSGIVSNLKNAFHFSWSLPHLSLPHISVSGGKAPYGIGGKGSLPKFNIQWYARGGITNGISLLGVGEAGREAILPLDKHTGWMDELSTRISPYIDLNDLDVGGGGVGDATLIVNVDVGGTNFGRVVVDSINELMDETGEMVLAI